MAIPMHRHLNDPNPPVFLSLKLPAAVALLQFSPVFSSRQWAPASHPCHGSSMVAAVFAASASPTKGTFILYFTELHWGS